MILHIFNPEHDLVLASGCKGYTPSANIRAMRSRLSYLPVYWADDHDVILTDDIETATNERNINAPGLKESVRFVSAEDLSQYDITGINPWGWDMAVKQMLIRHGIDKKLLPDDETLDTIRMMSHRRNTVPLMNDIRNELEDKTCGNPVECSSLEEIKEVTDRWDKVVVKAPWSSSGINIIFTQKDKFDSLKSRYANLISKQGSVMVEPLYNKVKDFAMEFYSHGDGNIDYLGLSVFENYGSAYARNIIASEEEKLAAVSKYIDSALLKKICSRIRVSLGRKYTGSYRGPFGVDMMIVEQNDNLLVDPCVEINLRRTMGHVAIAKWNAAQNM